MRPLGLAKYGCVAALRQFDDQPVGASFPHVVFAQPRSEPAGFGPHDRIAPGIVIRTTPENLNGNHGFFEVDVFALQMLFD